jgi:hypothetical protein
LISSGLLLLLLLSFLLIYATPNKSALSKVVLFDVTQFKLFVFFSLLVCILFLAGFRSTSTFLAQLNRSIKRIRKMEESSSTPTTTEQSPLPVPRTVSGDAPRDPGVVSGCHQSYTEKDYEGKIVFYLNATN